VSVEKGAGGVLETIVFAGNGNSKSSNTKLGPTTFQSVRIFVCVEGMMLKQQRYILYAEWSVESHV
jgi:hypothetical protein